MKLKDFRCTICDTVGNWENVDEIARHDKAGMCICNTCGFVSYPELYKSEEEIREYYREDYRPGPNVGNLFTGQRKLNYHEAFLKEYLDKWTKDKSKLVVGEIGAAYGLFLKWFRDILPGSEVFGSEMTLSYRRVAWKVNNVRLDEDLDLDNKKYDFLVSYKVEEHLMDPDKKLRAKVLALKPDGLIMISVPCWFNTMYLFGAPGFNLGDYYHLNHVNVWSQKLFETMLRKCGLEIVKENHIYYDSTYMCKRNDDLIDEKPVYEDPEEIKDIMRKIKAASMAYDNRDYKKAIEIYPVYPTAWQAVYENNRAQMHKHGYEGIVKDFITPMLASCPNSSAVVNIAGDLASRYGKWNEAIAYFKKTLEMKPQATEALQGIAHAYRNLAKQDSKAKSELLGESFNLMKYIMGISLQSRDECLSWQYADAAQIPLPWENETNV